MGRKRRGRLDDVRQQGSPGAAGTAGRGDARTVLVVDADPAVVQAARDYLEPEGYRVRGSAEPDEGLRLAKAGAVDLILVDMGLAGRDGYRLWKDLSADDETSRIPVVYASDGAQPTDPLFGFYAGGAGYLPKPFRRESIVQGVNRLLRH